MFYITKRTGKPDPGMMVNGMLAGLVAITAPCAFVAPWAAAVIGVIAAVIVIEVGVLRSSASGIDDPVGAIAVHGVGGTFGVLGVGIFANGKLRRRLERLVQQHGVKGLLYGDCRSARRPGPRCGRDLDRDLRVSPSASSRSRTSSPRAASAPRGRSRSQGLDIPEMGVLAYND